MCFGDLECVFVEGQIDIACDFKSDVVGIFGKGQSAVANRDQNGRVGGRSEVERGRWVLMGLSPEASSAGLGRVRVHFLRMEVAGVQKGSSLSLEQWSRT